MYEFIRIAEITLNKIEACVLSGKISHLSYLNLSFNFFFNALTI